MTWPTPPGWYPDPSGGSGKRYWNGQAWSGQVNLKTEPAQSKPTEPMPPRPARRIPAWGWVAFGAAAAIALTVGTMIVSDHGESRSTSTTSRSTASKPSDAQNTPSPTTLPPPAPPAASGPVNQQYFIGDVRAETPGGMEGPWVPWPDDQTLMSQGQQVCSVLSAHGGDWAAIETSPPAGMQKYAEGQLHEFISDATADLCYEYSSGKDLGTPPSQRLHAQNTMPPPATIGQEIHGETLDFTVTGVRTAKTVQTAYDNKTAKGIYVIVNMTVKNSTGTSQQLQGATQVLRDAAGWQFSGGGEGNENNTSNVLQKNPGGVDDVLPVANLDPGDQMTVGVMFDVPEGTQPSQIVLIEMRPGNNPPLHNPYGMVVNLS
jgi:hypothetical protein